MSVFQNSDYHQRVSLISLIDKGEKFLPAGIDEIYRKYRSIYDILSFSESEAVEGSRDFLYEPGIYLTEKETFLTIESKQTDPATLQEFKGESTHTDIKTDSTIFRHIRGLKTELISQIDGYLTVKNGLLSIFNPYILTEDRVHLFFIFLPVDYGKKALKENFFSKCSLSSKDSFIRSFSEDGIDRILNSGSIHTVTLSIGVKPEYGKDGSLLIRKKPAGKPVEDKDGVIDYRSFSAFLEVEEGTVLAEKKEGYPGKPGIDAYGKEIPVPDIQKVYFKGGNNVREEIPDKDGLTIYTAGITGNLNLTDSSVSVEEELIINGNAGIETGSIHYSKNITINGNIDSLITVECGGILIVKGSIENGAVVQCNGDAFVEKGIIGKKTSFFVRGYLETDFIQGVKIRVMGNLTVQNNIYDSQVFCGGELYVEGKKVKRKNKGCIIGSDVTSMKQMFLHSAGSEFSKTTLSCGIDLELTKQIDEMEKAIPLLNKKILGLQSRIGLDLAQTGIEVILKALPRSRKNTVKALLLEIKKTAVLKNTIGEKIETHKEKAVNPRKEELSIQISNHIVPETLVIIGELEKKIEKAENSIRIFIEHDQIVFKPL